jgi:hypothetical protein
LIGPTLRNKFIYPLRQVEVENQLQAGQEGEQVNEPQKHTSPRFGLIAIPNRRAACQPIEGPRPQHGKSDAVPQTFFSH